jgi:hypothetical protein
VELEAETRGAWCCDRREVQMRAKGAPRYTPSNLALGLCLEVGALRAGLYLGGVEVWRGLVLARVEAKPRRDASLRAALTSGGLDWMETRGFSIMDIEKKPRRLRIVTGTVAELEDQLNHLLNDYNAIVWAFAPVADAMRGTVVLLHNSVVMQQAIAQGGNQRIFRQ